MELITSLLLFCLVGPDGLVMAQQVLRSQTSARPRHVSLVLSSGDAASPTTSYPLAPRLPTAPAIQHHRSPRHTPPSARVRQGRLHGGGRLHLTVQRLRSPRSEADISGQPSRPLAPLGANRRAMSAPKAAGLGRRSQAAGGGRGEGPRVGQARRRRAAALGAQGRGCAGAGSRAGAVLRIPARVRGHRHRRRAFLAWKLLLFPFPARAMRSPLTEAWLGVFSDEMAPHRSAPSSSTRTSGRCSG